MLSGVFAAASATTVWATVALGALHLPDLTPLGYVVVVVGIVGTIQAARAYGKQRAGEVWQTTAAAYKEEAQAEREHAERIRRETAEEIARVKVESADHLRRLEAERDEQRALKHECLSSLAAVSAKTDLSAVMEGLGSIMQTLKPLADNQAAQTELLGKLVERVEVLAAMGGSSRPDE